MFNKEQPAFTIRECTGEEQANKIFDAAKANNEELASVKNEFVDGAWHYSMMFAKIEPHAEDVKEVAAAKTNNKDLQ